MSNWEITYGNDTTNWEKIWTTENDLLGNWKVRWSTVNMSRRATDKDMSKLRKNMRVKEVWATEKKKIQAFEKSYIKQLRKDMSN